MRKFLLLIIAFSFAFTSFAQDTCATALSITAGSYTVDAVNGTEIPDPICAANGAGATAGEWYTFTATLTGAASIDTNLAANAGGDTRVHIYTGTCGSLVCHASNDDVDANNYLSYVLFPITTGETYTIAFDDRWAADGFDFVLTEDASQSCQNTLPFDETWSTVFGLGCWTVEDANSDNLTWSLNGVNDFNADGTNDAIVNIFPPDTGSPEKNDWLYSQAFAMDATHTYDVTVRYNSITVNFTADETLNVAMTDAPNASANATSLANITNIIPLGTYGDTTGNDPIAMAYTSTTTFTPPASGDYHLALQGATAAGGDVLFITEVHIVDNNAASVNDNILSSSVSIYPNVTSDNFTIKNTSNIALTSVSIFDINGRVVSTSNLNNLIGEKSINVSNLSAGMYFVEINSADAKITRKLIKK